VRRLLAGAVAVAVLLGGLTVANAVRRPAEPRPEVGYPAPDFELPTPEGEPVRLSDYRGRPVLLNFWATWCPPCRVEMPHIQAVHEAYGARLVVLAVAVQDDWAFTRPFMDRYGFTFTALQDREMEATFAYRIQSLPTSVFVDREGIIRQIWTGLMTREAMEAAVRAVVDGY